MNENRFFLRTKILIKIKIRYKKKFTKKFHGGQFSGERFFCGAFFPGAFFLEPFWQLQFIKKYYLPLYKSVCETSLIRVDKTWRHLVKFLREGHFCEFLYLCFGVKPAPQIFAKFYKVLVSLLLSLNIRY